MPYVLVNYTYLFPKMLKNNPFFLFGVDLQKMFSIQDFLIFFWIFNVFLKEFIILIFDWGGSTKTQKQVS